VGNGRFRPSLPDRPGCSLTAVGCGEGRRSKRKREKKRENLGQCCPLMAKRWLGCQRRLRLKNLRTVSWIRTSRGANFFVAVFSSSEAMRKRGKS
ncbi:hypothetical protein GW17_00017366, partial [Ensete ventricosum]